MVLCRVWALKSVFHLIRGYLQARVMPNGVIVTTA